MVEVNKRASEVHWFFPLPQKQGVFSVGLVWFAHAFHIIPTLLKPHLWPKALNPDSTTKIPIPMPPSILHASSRKKKQDISILALSHRQQIPAGQTLPEIIWRKLHIGNFLPTVSAERMQVRSVTSLVGASVLTCDLGGPIGPPPKSPKDSK